MATKKVGFKCSRTLMSGTHHEDVGNSIQDDKDSFAILWRQQTEKRLKHIGLNEVDHLLDSASTGEVCNSPDSLFLSFVVTLRGKGGRGKSEQQMGADKLDELVKGGQVRGAYPHKHVNQVRNKACVDDLLDLGVLPCCDVGQSPCCLLLNIGFFVAQQLRKHGQSLSIQHSLSLLISTGHYVSNGTQCRGLKNGRKQLP